MSVPETVVTTAASSTFGPIVIAGQPSPAQLAAIVAAIELTWPEPAQIRSEPPQSSPWRWSGRWWAQGSLAHGWSAQGW